MKGRSATDEDVGTVHLGVSGTSWPAAEKAGLVNAGGMWMLERGYVDDPRGAPTDA